MSEPNDPSADPAGLRGPGDPEAAKDRQQQAERDAALYSSEVGGTDEARTPQPEPAQAANIREEQLTQAAGTVPAAYVGSGDAAGDGSGAKPEDAVDGGGWDDEI
ncbi:hypothetical protein [Arthrobacter sp. Soil763]|uniref:hypothetical protein n=1 Tax=Arthrobacter sp. Soil763 TaxID=1736402 RepID=UPI0006F5F8F9|nr:hypothetical protein [Arthrobacter sp. Soil763]KRE79295.1 hypothetical protein ASG71_04145 [Arthrobacter sp. Soil763]